MPPKKFNDADEGSGKLTWEGPNDTKLLLLTQGRYVKPDEYDNLSKAFPGTTTGSIRNRISALRVKQRNLYEELGWEVPEGGAGHSAKKKRGGSIEEPETPSKKPRVVKKKGKKEEVVEEKAKESEDGLDGDSGGIKEEVDEDSWEEV